MFGNYLKIDKNFFNNNNINNILNRISNLNIHNFNNLINNSNTNNFIINYDNEINKINNFIINYDNEINKINNINICKICNKEIEKKFKKSFKLNCCNTNYHRICLKRLSKIKPICLNCGKKYDSELLDTGIMKQLYKKLNIDNKINFTGELLNHINKNFKKKKVKNKKKINLLNESDFVDHAWSSSIDEFSNFIGNYRNNMNTQLKKEYEHF